MMVVLAACSSNGKLQQMVENINTSMAGTQVPGGGYCQGITLDGSDMVVTYAYPGVEAHGEYLDPQSAGYNELYNALEQELGDWFAHGDAKTLASSDASLTYRFIYDNGTVTFHYTHDQLMARQPQQ